MNKLKELQPLVDKLQNLLKQPEPGLMTWCEAYADVMRKIDGIWHGNYFCQGPFKVDLVSSDDEYLYVDIDNAGTVQIKKDTDGIVVDILPFHVTDESVASAWATYAELSKED